MHSTREELAAANEALRADNALLAQARDFAVSVFNAVQQPLLVLDRELRIRMSNQAFRRAFHVSQREVEDQTLYSLSNGDWNSPALRAALIILIHRGTSFTDLEITTVFRDLGRRILVFGGCQIDPLNMILVSVDDVTGRPNAEQSLSAVHTEATGRLADGIAHEFTNLFTAITGYSSLLLDSLKGNEQAIQQALAIRTAGDRATMLGQQLVSFGQRQAPRPDVLDLNGIAQDMEGTMRGLVNERIAVVIDCAPGLWHAWADPDGTDRAIMNLFLNAKEATPDSGTVTIQTANVTVTEDDAPEWNLAPGPYVMLAVRDSRASVDAGTKARIFEPFPAANGNRNGNGNGLGMVLAAVRGFAEQSGGAVRCESEPGQTTFRLLLPALTGAVDNIASQTGSPSASEALRNRLAVAGDESIRAGEIDSGTNGSVARPPEVRRPGVNLRLTRHRGRP